MRQRETARRAGARLYREPKKNTGISGIWTDITFYNEYTPDADGGQSREEETEMERDKKLFRRFYERRDKGLFVLIPGLKCASLIKNFRLINITL